MVRTWLIALGGLGFGAAVVGSLVVSEPSVALGIALGYQLYELAVAALLTASAVAGIRGARRLGQGGSRPSLAVVVAAHNEKRDVLATLASIRANGLACEIVVASDGSTDGMNELLVDELKLVPDGPQRFRSGDGASALRLLVLAKAGKAAALNAALQVVESEVLVTLDADTSLEAGSLAALADRFRDPTVHAAAGFIYVRNATVNLLTRYQYTEYLKNFVWRIGLARLGVCLQVSGAFGALRTATLRSIGGFAKDSLVEDYEVIYRLHEALRRRGDPYQVVAVPEAAAFTDGPEQLGNFIAQRTRWFTGFLQTLWAYRRMIGSPRYGAIGLFMLPIKCVDAWLPLWGLATILVLGGLLATGHGRWPTWAGELFLGRWLLDAALYVGMVAWHRVAYPSRTDRVPSIPAQLVTATTESVGFNWLRQLAVLRAYVWYVRRTQRWEQSRWASGSGSATNESRSPPKAA